MKKVFGVILGAISLLSTAAFGQTLTAKQTNSLQADGTAISGITGGAYYQLLGGVDSNGNVQALSVDSTGILSVSVGGSSGSALSDNMANPTTAGFGAYLLGFDGSTWDRLRVDSSGNLLVSLGTNLDFTNDSITAHGPLADDAAFTHG
ncbi:MAG TPA: hypothetical protein VEA38_19200, partial [Terriglobales bacterium]|nr:hypothetical protein [Terriglobales bacterium]